MSQEELDVVNLFGRSFAGYCEFELKTFYLEKLEVSPLSCFHMVAEPQ